MLRLSFSSLFLLSLLTGQQVRHRRGLDVRGRRPPERRGGLGELLADAQRRELFHCRGRLGGAVVRRRRL